MEESVLGEGVVAKRRSSESTMSRRRIVRRSQVRRRCPGLRKGLISMCIGIADFQVRTSCYERQALSPPLRLEMGEYAHLKGTGRVSCKGCELHLGCMGAGLWISDVVCRFGAGIVHGSAARKGC